MPPNRSNFLRLLIVLPSWVGDVAMATPTLRAIRNAYPGVFIAGMARAGIDELLESSGLVDEVLVVRSSGVMGIKRAAARARPLRFDAALLLKNSFSSALMARVAGIPRRIGYDRDVRGMLLTDALDPPRRPDGSWEPISAVRYYWNLAAAYLLDGAGRPTSGMGTMELDVSPAQAAAGEEILSKAGVGRHDRVAMLNPGANAAVKRWPADRFAAIADRLSERGWKVLVNGSPAEADVVAAVLAACRGPAPVALPTLGIRLGSLKHVIRRANLVVTNDTGPRHMAAALGTPLVSLFGPTDVRWAIIPTRPGAPEACVIADPTLPPELIANDHHDRCAMTKISVDRAWEAVESVIGSSHQPANSLTA